MRHGQDWQRVDRRFIWLLPMAAALAACGVERSPTAPPTPSPSPLFVAVGSGGHIVTSPDGSTWTGRASGVERTLSAVAAGRSRVVAVGAGGTVVSSSDGVTWVKGASPTTADLSQIIYATDHFIAVGGSWQKGAVTLTSADGASWTELPSPSTHMFHGVVEGKAGLIAAAYLRSDLQVPAQFHASADGAWLMGEGPDFYQGINANDLLVVVGGAVSLSADGGGSWETTLPGWTGVQSVAFGAGTFVVVGEGGLLFTSADARTWTLHPSSFDQTSSFYGVTYASGRFVSVGSAGKIMTSTDGVSWGAATSGLGDHLGGVAYFAPSP